MIGTSYGHVTFTCDECESDEIDTEETDARSAVQTARQNGWSVVRGDDGVVHLCPRCTTDLEPDEEEE